MRRVVFTISKEGEVQVEATGYEGKSCLQSKKVKEILEILKQEGEIDLMQVQEEQRQAIMQEESLW